MIFAGGLETALLALANPCRAHQDEPTVEIVRHAAKHWQSITFSGSRHTVELAFVNGHASGRSEAFCSRLPRHEFAIAGQLVADAVVTNVHRDLARDRVAVTCDILLLEDC